MVAQQKRIALTTLTVVNVRMPIVLACGKSIQYALFFVNCINSAVRDRYGS
jgi:hypothetical protein